MNNLLAAFSDPHVSSYANKIDLASGLNSRLLDTAASLDYVCKDIELRGIKEALCAGDLYRSSKPTMTEMCYVMRSLYYSKVNYWMIAGNHDMPRSSNESTAIDPLITVDNNVYFVNMPRVIQRETYQLACLPFPNRSKLAEVIPDYNRLSPAEADEVISGHIALILQNFRQQLVPGVPSVLMMHLSVDVAESGTEKEIMVGRDITIPLSAIPDEFDFVVLGHIHKPQDFAKYGRPNMFYCGSTDRINFGEESEEKSYVIMNLDDKTWERVSIPCRNYCTIDVEYDNDGVYTSHANNIVTNSICRIKIKRPDNVRPNYDELLLDTAGCFDFRGFTEDVRRTSLIRSEEIVKAESLPELLTVWHESKGCEVNLDDLIHAGQEIERQAI